MEFPCEQYYAFCELQVGHGVGASARRRASFLSAKYLMLVLVGFDELSNFGTGSNRFDEYDVSLVQEHTVRPMPFITTPHQSVGNRLGIRIDLTLYVVHVCQLRKSGACIDQLAVVNLPVIQQNCSIRGRNLRPLPSMFSATGGQNRQQHQRQDRRAWL